MLRSYLKIFLQQCLGSKLYAAINVLGLAAGLTCCLLIALFVRHELSYDGFYPNADDIYRVSLEITRQDGASNLFTTNSAPAAPLLKENFPQVREAARVRPRQVLLSRDDLAFYESGFRMVDAAFFTLFDFVWLQGSPETSLGQPNAMILTETLARKYFGEGNPLGQELLLDNQLVAQVTGVIADLPGNTHLSGTAFATMGLMSQVVPDVAAALSDWDDISYITYVQLQPGSDMARLEEQFPAFLQRYATGFPPGMSVAMRPIPLRDLHMKASGNADFKPPGSMSVVYIFSAIGVCILLIACVNFMNLSTARASRRSREVGLRKTLGASRAQLIRQFMIESISLCGIAMLIAISLVELLLPVVTAFLEIEISLGILSDPVVLPILAATTLLLGACAGWYPALVLSRPQPVQVMRAYATGSEAGQALRGILVVLQFAVAIVLVVASSAVFMQMQFTSDMELGFKEDSVVVITADASDFAASYPEFRNLLLQDARITSVASSLSSPLRRPAARVGMFRAEADTAEVTVPAFPVDVDYFATYGIDLVAGRYFSPDQASDRMPAPGSAEAGTRGSYIINETAARQFGWSPETAIGNSLMTGSVGIPVIGVVRDTIESSRLAASPVVYSMPEAPMAGNYISVKIGGDSIQAALDHIDASWRAVNPVEPIRRVFFDDTIAALYLQEGRQLNLSYYFAGLSIVIACLGLYGLASFDAERRTKEIGVRKVMGGTVWSIVLLLTSDFSKLVLVSNVIAWPVAYVAVERWLENFAYRIDLTPLLFIGSGAIALCIAWVTVGGTAAKAATQKPVLALRYE